MSAPDKLQKSWREFTRACGSCISYRVPCEIHHPFGRTSKVKDVGNISHWFVLAMIPEEHRLIDRGAWGLQELKDRFEVWHPDIEPEIYMDESLHEFEKFLFFKHVEKFHRPFSQEIYEAIESWHR